MVVKTKNHNLKVVVSNINKKLNKLYFLLILEVCFPAVVETVTK